MRSRYTAYALGLVDYIVETTDPLGPLWRDDLAAWRAEIEAFSATTRFLGLTVRGAGTVDDDAWVKFEARLSTGGKPETMVERSRFVRRDGHWRYHAAMGA